MLLPHIYELKYVYSMYYKNIKLYKKYLKNDIDYKYFIKNYNIIFKDTKYTNEINLLSLKNNINNKHTIDLFNSYHNKKECLSFYSVSFMMLSPILIINFNDYLNINLNQNINNYERISCHTLVINFILSLLHWSNYNPGSFIQKMDIFFVFICGFAMLYDYFNVLTNSNINIILNCCASIFIIVGELDILHIAHAKTLNIKYNYDLASFYIHNAFRIVGFISVLYLNIYFDNIFNYVILFFYTIINVVLLSYVSYIYSDIIHTRKDYIYFSIYLLIDVILWTYGFKYVFIK